MCFNKKVVGGVAVTALAVFALAPNLFGVALPFLVMAACPLSMTLMMRRMGGQSSCGHEAAGRSALADSTPNATQAAELQALRDEIDRLRAERSVPAGGEVAAG